MSTSTIDRVTGARRGRLRRAMGLVALVLAGALLAAMAWSTLRVAWFVETSDYCDQQTCTWSVAEQAWVRGGDALDTVVAGEDAMEASGLGTFEFTFTYLPLTVMALVLALVLFGTGAALRRSAHRRGVTAENWAGRVGIFLLADPVGRVVVAGLVAVTLIQLLAYDQIMWATNVTE